MKSAKKTRLFHIFVSPVPRHGQVKELIWGKWAIFYFSIMFMHKEVWGKLVTFDLFSA